jgi:hypothetical protein
VRSMVATEGLTGEASANVFDDVERFYNPSTDTPTIGYISPMGSERKAERVSRLSTKPVQVSV